MTAWLQPGAWIGVIGGGQLGRMLALEARRMGYRVCVLDPDPRGPAAQVADEHIAGPYDGTDALQELAHRADVITYEFEHINADAVAAVEQLRPVYPGSALLRMTQHRVREKETLARLGFPLPAFHPVASYADVEAGIQRVGLPAVLKTATGGYDGKGQVVVGTTAEAHAAFDLLWPMSPTLVLEEYVRLGKELSVVCARNARGQVACYPPAENIHRRGVLDITLAPALVPAVVATQAHNLATRLVQELKVVGLLAVEFFLTESGRLLVNELAPRPHNSAHYTLDACVTSQFEQLVRVLCNLPLGETEPLAPSVMVNLLGDLWEDTDGAPNFARALEVPGVTLHLYGKAEPRPGRKMGHLCAVAPTLEVAHARALRARDLAAGKA